MGNKVILGLGSSCGNRLAHLRHAVTMLKNTSALQVVNIAPVYISDALLPDNAPAEWQTYYLNSAVSCMTDLPPLELLALIKKIEQNMGRKPADRWAPRIIDIDILSYDKLIIQNEKISIPHQGILERPFVLWPLLDVQPDGLNLSYESKLEQWGDRFSANAPFHTRQLPHQIVGPELIGIINLTPDSFSGDGFFVDYQRAIERAKQLFADGATVLDIGGEATNPHAGINAINSEKECKRLQPFLEMLRDVWQPEDFQPLISIDTYHAQTVEKILDYKVDWINDESTKESSVIAELLCGTDKKYLFMHNLGIPAVKGVYLPPNCNPVKEIFNWAEMKRNELCSLGLSEEQLIFDPGIGFGNSPAQAVKLLQNIAQFKKLELPICVGHSRKVFMNQFTSKSFSDRDFETSLITSYLSTQPVNYLRVHNIAANNQAIKISELFSASSTANFQETECETMGI